MSDSNFFQQGRWYLHVIVHSIGAVTDTGSPPMAE